MKEWVVVRFVKDGKFKIWADYGDMAWGSPLYEVMGYFPNHAAARKFVKEEAA